MHSKLFNQFDPKDEDNKVFGQALSELLSFTKDQWKIIISTFPMLAEARTNDEREPIIKKLQSETIGIDRHRSKRGLANIRKISVDLI